MIAANPLDSNDRPLFEPCNGHVKWISSAVLPARVKQLECGATYRTGNRLGMEAPIIRVTILPLAIRTERESGHGGVRPVVGGAGDDRIARAAVGAVDERITIAPVSGVKKLAKAVRADITIRRNQSVAMTVTAFDYSEALFRD